MNIYDLKQIQTSRLLIRPPKLGDEIELNKAINNSLEALQRWMPWAKDPILETKRLKLIPPKEEDTKALYKILMGSLDQLSPWFSWATKDLSIEKVRNETRTDAAAALDIKAHKELFYIVWDKDEKNILGEIFLEIKDWSVPYTEIGYWFDTSQTGKGYASEAVTELTRYAFNNLKCKRVYIDACQINQPSINLAKRLGFTHEGTLQNHARNFVTNKILATELFAMTNLDQLNKDN